MAVSGVIEERVRFPSGPNTLEGVLAYPEDIPPVRAILLLSPHPHLGGRMDNNVIAYLAQRLAADGCATLRFNYAGVGGSGMALPEGETPYEYWERVELEKNYRAVLPDALAAYHYLLSNTPDAPIGFIGYSFGACLAVLLATVHRPSWLSAISPPVSRAPLEGLEALTMPSQFIAGDRDFVFDAAVFAPLFARVPGPKTFIELSGSDHFFRKEESRVYEAIVTRYADSVMEGIAP